LIFFCGDFAELFERGFEVFAPSTQDTAWPYALARGRPEQNESRDDDLPGQNIGIGEIVGFFEAFVAEPKMSTLALSRLKNQPIPICP
jgi:hypothetical protein